MKQRYGSRFPCCLKIKLKTYSQQSCFCYLKNLGLGGACIATESTDIKLISCRVGEYIDAEIISEPFNKYTNFHSKAEVIYVEPGHLGVTWTEQNDKAYEPLYRLVQLLSNTKIHA